MRFTLWPEIKFNYACILKKKRKVGKHVYQTHNEFSHNNPFFHIKKFEIWCTFNERDIKSKLGF